MGVKKEANQCKRVWLGSGEVGLASVHLPSIENIYLSCILPFFGSHEQPNSAKHRFLGKFVPHNTIYTFKNYFVIVFLAISFQFLTNKRYLNNP